MLKRCLLMVFALLMLTAWALAASPFESFDAALQAAEHWGEAVMDVGTVRWTPKQLQQLREALPEGTALKGSFVLCGKARNIEAEELDLDNAADPLTTADLEAMTVFMPNLQRIIAAEHAELDNKVMMPLVDAHPELTFVWTVHLRTYAIRSDATAFSTKRGELPGVSLESKDLDVLRYVPGLRALDLGHHRINDISFLKYFPEMRILILADNRIGDISPIAALTHLEYCELFMNGIRDLSPLSACTELKDLNIGFNSFYSLEPLDGLQNLERMWCCGSKLGKAAKEHFTQTHPDCEVDFVSSTSTMKGWREHPRFFQYMEMFETRTWKEFE